MTEHNDTEPKIIYRIVCWLGEHDWQANGPMYSDGWESKCSRCGKTKNVTR